MGGGRSIDGSVPSSEGDVVPVVTRSAGSGDDVAPRIVSATTRGSCNVATRSAGKGVDHVLVVPSTLITYSCPLPLTPRLGDADGGK